MGNFTKKDNDLSFLPFAYQCRDDDWKEIVIKHFQNLKEPNDFQEKLVTHLINKRWNKKIYKTFRSSVVRFNKEQLRMAKEAILLCLEKNDEELLNELNRIKKYTLFYPSVKRTKDAKTGMMIIEENEMHPIDVFKLIEEFMKLMDGYISRDSQKYVEKYKDIELLVATINLLLGDDDIEFKNRMLRPFDFNFYYIRTSPIFYSFFSNVRDKYFELLVDKLGATLYSKRIEVESGSIYDYLKIKKL